jgi:hypothetical protein
MLIRDCWLLKKQKRYSYCILNLCQAYEMYFALYLRVMLIYKPYGNENNHDLDGLNESLRKLFDRINDWTYSPLRNTLIHLAHQSKEIYSIDQAIADTSGRPVIPGWYVLNVSIGSISLSLNLLLRETLPPKHFLAKKMVLMR